jgi:hypothetical protein
MLFADHIPVFRLVEEQFDAALDGLATKGSKICRSPG